jgi:PIN domain nuclease of toxin-antitoxin system
VRLLLDTHTLLWTIGKTDELTKKVMREITNTNNEIFVSAVSLWEIALKHSIGKLIINFNVHKIADYCKKMGFTLIPLEPMDALNSLRLPQKNNHKDPFDRMLIYQSISNKYILVSKDAKMELYKDDGLRCLW